MTRNREHICIPLYGTLSAAATLLLIPSMTYAVIPGQPFIQGATISVDNDPPAPLTLPPGPAQAAVAYVNPGGSSACSDCEEALQTCAPIPVPSTVSDWNTFYYAQVGIEVTDTWQNFQFGSSSRPATVDDIIRHIGATFATINAVFKRDVGVVLQIKHVRLLKQVKYVDTNGEPTDYPSYSYWQSNLPAVNFVYRLLAVPSYGGGASYALCSHGGGGGHVNYDLTADPQRHDGTWFSTVDTVGHELSHIFGGDHTDFYNPIIEYCSSQCYQGQQICPPHSEESWSGYCRYSCCTCPDGTAAPCPQFGQSPSCSGPNPGTLRFGPLFGPMSRVIRTNVLNAGACLQAGEVFTGDRTQDTDGDGYPDALDNCRTTAKES